MLNTWLSLQLVFSKKEWLLFLVKYWKPIVNYDCLLILNNSGGRFTFVDGSLILSQNPQIKSLLDLVSNIMRCIFDTIIFQHCVFKYLTGNMSNMRYTVIFDNEEVDVSLRKF